MTDQHTPATGLAQGFEIDFEALSDSLACEAEADERVFIPYFDIAAFLAARA